MSYQTLNDSAAPATPAAGKVSVYSETGGRLRAKAASGADGYLAPGTYNNLIRNSGFWFAQRQVPGTLTTYSNVGGRITAGADGWGISNENASIQYRRVDSSGAVETNLYSRFWGEFTKLTANGKIQIMQALEGSNCANLRGRNVRLTMKMKSIVAASAQWNIAIVALGSGGTIDVIPSTAGNFFTAQGANGVDPTLAANQTYIAPTAGKTGDNCTAGANSYACTVTAAWQRFSGVFTIPTTAKNLIVLVYSHNQVTVTNGLGVTEVMLSDGEHIQEWQAGSIYDEFQRVQRYYLKTFNMDTNPAQSVGLNTGEFKFACVVAGAVATAGVGFRFPVPMFKAATTLTLYNPSAANVQVRNVTDSADMTGSTVTANGEQGCWINFTGLAGNAAGEHLAVHLSADAEI